MSKSKNQGTYFETWMVKWLNRISDVDARRIAEGGSKDEGDVMWYDAYERTYYAECKATQTLNVTRVLSKARLKSPDPKRTVLFWKRLVKPKGEGVRRRPDGEPVVVVMGLDTFHELIGGHVDD